MRHRLASGVLLSLLALPATAQDVRIEAPPEIAALLRPWLPETARDDPASLAQTRRRLEKGVPEWLATEGYFSPTIELAEGDGLRLRIVPGPRTRIAGVDVGIAGPLPEAERAALVERWLLPAGKPFRQEDWSAAKQDVLSGLLALGHAAARLDNSLADIDPERAEARLYAHYEAGPPYRFGELKVEGLERYPPGLVERYNRMVRPGDPYREDRLAALQNTLQGTPYFSSVQVAIDREAEPQPGPDGSVTAPVRVLVREREPHRLGLGAGASSNTGARVELNYQTADLFRNAWELNSGLRLEQKRQVVYADVFLPPDRGGYRHSVGGLVEHSDIQKLAVERVALGAQRVHQRGSLEMRLSLNWQQERRRPEGAEETTNRALVPDSTWTWRKVDSLLDPRDGTVARVQLGGASKAVLSDRDFVRAYGRWQQFVPLGRRNVLTLRAELGYTAAASRQGIPQDYLFRTGGTSSVRGYAYQSLGVREGDAVVGGRFLATGSAEVTHWLGGDWKNWGVAAFVDAGDAADRASAWRAAWGYGVGARWKSPAGPVAVDVAYGERTRRFQLHFSLAIPF